MYCCCYLITNSCGSTVLATTVIHDDNRLMMYVLLLLDDSLTPRQVKLECPSEPFSLFKPVHHAVKTRHGGNVISFCCIVGQLKLNMDANSYKLHGSGYYDVLLLVSSPSFWSPSNTLERYVRVKGQGKSDEEDGRWLRRNKRSNRGRVKARWTAPPTVKLKIVDIRFCYRCFILRFGDDFVYLPKIKPTPTRRH